MGLNELSDFVNDFAIVIPKLSLSLPRLSLLRVFGCVSEMQTASGFFREDNSKMPRNTGRQVERDSERETERNFLAVSHLTTHGYET